MTLTRRRLVLGGTAALSLPAFARRGFAAEPPEHGLGYLEAMGAEGALRVPYLPPSRLHASYQYAFYVNTAFSGAAKQKMWVLERSGTGWQLALSDRQYWERKGAEPEYSWPVSSGALHAGESRAGPTPSGVFNLDERKYRYRAGWGSPGMYKAVYIDLHYSSGRVSGVAMHGTTAGQYRRLGTPASHGCVRMTQANMDQVHALLHPTGARAEGNPLWGEVPRYFRSEPADSPAARLSYVRDGALLEDTGGALLTKQGYRAVFVFFRDDL